MRKAIILGSAGYFGCTLSAHLVEAGYQIHTPDIVNGNRVDLTDASRLENVNWDVDAVFVMAGRIGNLGQFDDHAATMDANQGILANILSAIARSNHRPHVIFPSTRLVYDGCADAIPENGAQLARSVYAASKIACEALLQAFGNFYEIPYTVLRLCVAFGGARNQMTSRGTVGMFLNQIQSTGKVRIYGDGSQWRSFTHVADFVRYCDAVVQAPNCMAQIYNVPGEDLTLAQAAQSLCARFGAQLEHVPWPVNSLKLESGSTRFDGSALVHDTGLHPQYGFRDWVANATLDRPSA